MQSTAPLLGDQDLGGDTFQVNPTSLSWTSWRPPAGVAHEAVGLYVYYIQFFLLTSVILSCYVSRAMHVNLASFFLVVATGALPREKYVSRMPFCKPCGCIFWFPCVILSFDSSPKFPNDLVIFKPVARCFCRISSFS